MDNPQIIATPISPITTRPTSSGILQQPQATSTVSKQTVDASYVEVELPSGYKFYDFKHLYIRPFKQKHLRKLIQGQANKNARIIAEVVNSCITCELGYEDLVFRLCREDFTYLQYWERMYSFPNIQYTQMCECKNPEHIRKVEEGEMDERSLIFPQAITKAQLQVTNLPDKEYNFEKYIPKSLKDQFGDRISMHHPTMADYLDLIDLAEQQVGDNDDEGLAWFTTGVPASMLRIVKEDGSLCSLSERFDIVDELSPEDVLQLQTVEDEVPEFGVVQKINARCPRCGALTTVKMVLNAHSFLPRHNDAGSFGS